MFVYCNTCTRRLEWSAKRDKPLRALVCPHCGSDYRRTANYLDAHDPADLLRRSDQCASRLELAAARLQAALKEAARLPGLITDAETAVQALVEQRPRLILLRGESEGAA